MGPPNEDDDNARTGPWEAIGRTIRYAIATNPRTARLCMLMVAAIEVMRYRR